MSNKSISAKPLSDMELSSFCGQISLVLKSGISAMEGLNIMLEDSDSQEERDILRALLDGMEETGSLYEAMQKTELFPSYMVNMIHIGEETGTLDDVTDALRVHYEREASISRSIRNAVTYPMIMTGMMIIVVVVLLVKVMPVFNQVFMQLGTEMTGFSRMLMNMGTVIGRYSVVFIIILAAIALFGLYGVKTASGRKLLKTIGYKIPGTRRIMEQIAACRFAGGMALTLSSGLNPERCMELVGSLNDDEFFGARLDECRRQLDDGEDLSRALYTSGIFTGMYARMASIGGKTGSMDQVMDQIASLYQDDIDSRMSNTIAVLEPTLVIILSVIVGIILMSVMLPLLGIMSGI